MNLAAAVPRAESRPPMPLESGVPRGLGAIGRSFFWKLYLSYAGLVLVTAAIIGALVLSNLQKNTLRDAEASLYGTARLIAAMEAANPAHLWSDQLARQVGEVATDAGVHLTLIFANGTAAAESVVSLAAISPAETLRLPEFHAARQSNLGRATRKLVAAGAEHLLVAVPILLDFEIIGYVRAGMPLDRLAERQSELRGRVLIGATVNAIVALGLGFFFARRVTRPLATIGATCERLAAGKLDERIKLERNDEIGVVARTINQMADDVQRRIYGETRERQRLATLLAVMADGVVAVSARQTISYMNEVAARLLGLDESAKGRSFIGAVKLGSVREIYQEALAGDKRVVREVRINGHPQDTVLGVDAMPLRDPSGGPFGVLLVLHDFSAIRRLEEVRRTFTANVSHELKTPLTAIGSLVDTLLEDESMLPEVRQRFLGKIRDQNERLGRLVRDLLIISRLESEREVLVIEDVELGATLSECVHTFDEVAQKKGLHLEWTPPGAAVLVRGNHEALRLIFNNLLHNAVTYTGRGGSIAIGVTVAAGMASVTIRDTGIGIAAEHLDRIFERFYRVDKARDRVAGGTGLGLSIVKHLTQALDGCVQVESRTGEGSAFTVQLRMVEGNGGREAGEPRAPASAARERS